jgi:hypothetical protein
MPPLKLILATFEAIIAANTMPYAKRSETQGLIDEKNRGSCYCSFKEMLYSVLVQSLLSDLNRLNKSFPVYSEYISRVIDLKLAKEKLDYVQYNILKTVKIFPS